MKALDGKKGGVPEVPPQRITDLDNATRQLHQLSYILDTVVAPSRQAMKSVKRSFTLDPFSHHVSLCPISTFHLPHGSVICWFWMDPSICENVARAACTL